MTRIRKYFKKKPKKNKKKKPIDKFYKSREWKELRYEVLSESDGYCTCCGKRKGDKLESGQHVHLTIEHLLPRSKYPVLGLYKPNLEVRCQECNIGKNSIVENKYLWIYEQWKNENGLD